MLKAGASAWQQALYAVLGSSCLLYGEWVYAKHTSFYDALPQYFLAFDALDTRTKRFLSTPRRHALLHGLSVASVPVPWSGTLQQPASLPALLGPSQYKTAAWRQYLVDACVQQHLDPELVWRETDNSDLMEGLYVKVEDARQVLERYKFVRDSFLAAVDQSGSHWLTRPLLCNRLRVGVDLFAL